MRVIVFDTETNGLPKGGNKSPPNPYTWPYVCQLSWLVFDDVTEKLYTRDYIIRLPEGVTIPKVCSDIHGITNERMRNEGVDISGVLQEFTSDWMNDAGRRDFTINAIYADKEGNLFDPYDGKKDLKNGKVTFIGDSEKRIKEDYLRILRYIRFFLNYSRQEHQQYVKKSIKKNLNGINNLSKERLIGELEKIIISKGFLKLCKDKFCKEIILIIFPQLKYIDIFKKLNKHSQNSIDNKSFIFLLSFLIIDETDNSNYFLYKFNLSKENKKRINFLRENYLVSFEKNFISKKNFQKIFYFYGKSYLIDLIDFKLFKSNKNYKKLIELKKYFKNIEKPLFPIKANVIMEKYKIKEGKELGNKLKYLENLWIENSFKISDKDVDKVFLN